MPNWTRSIFSIVSRIARGFLTNSQQLFNDTVKCGKYDLQALIETSEWNNSGGSDKARKWSMSDGNKYDDKHAIIMSDEGHIYGVEKSKINKQQFKKLFDAFAKSEDISYLKTNCKDLT